MWVHPDLLDDQQWTRVSGKKKRHKAKASNMISPSLNEDDAHLTPLTDSEEEKSALAAEQGANPGASTRLGKTYLKRYDQTAEEVEKPDE